MADDDEARKLHNEKHLETFKAQISRQELLWRARFDTVLESDRAAFDIGLVALKTAILVNAGAVVALLAFVGQLWGNDQDRETLAAVLRGMKPFVGGLVAAGVAAGIAYIYQSISTRLSQQRLAEVSDGSKDLEPLKWFPRFATGTKLAVILLVAASYGAFIWGALGVVAVLGQSSSARVLSRAASPTCAAN